jgi:hypothetical protein
LPYSVATAVIAAAAVITAAVVAAAATAAVAAGGGGDTLFAAHMADTNDPSSCRLVNCAAITVDVQSQQIMGRL